MGIRLLEGGVRVPFVEFEVPFGCFLAGEDLRVVMRIQFMWLPMVSIKQGGIVYSIIRLTGARQVLSDGCFCKLGESFRGLKAPVQGWGVDGRFEVHPDENYMAG